MNPSSTGPCNPRASAMPASSPAHNSSIAKWSVLIARAKRNSTYSSPTRMALISKRLAHWVRFYSLFRLYDAFNGKVLPQRSGKRHKPSADRLVRSSSLQSVNLGETDWLTRFKQIDSCHPGKRCPPLAIHRRCAQGDNKDGHTAFGQPPCRLYRVPLI